MSNKFDINVLINNFNILRKSKGLNKGEFNKLIGMVNVFRPNYFSIGAKLLKGIQDNFPGIDENWLLTPHDIDYEFPEKQFFKQATGRSINEPSAQYTHTNATSQPGNNTDYLIKTAAILESPTIFNTALKSNIDAFHHALVCEEKLASAINRIEELEEWKKSVEKKLPAVNGS